MSALDALKKPAPKKAAPEAPVSAPVAAALVAQAPAAGTGGYAAQKAAVAPAAQKPKGLLGKIEAEGQSLLKGAEGVGQKVKDGAMNAGGEAIGLAEMVGLKYPVKIYEAQVSGQLYRGSRVEDDAHMAALAKQGVKGIVNLCAENDMDTARANKFGIKPLHIPIIDNTAASLSQVQQFLEFVNGSGPAYVHCEAGQGRTGTMVGAYRIAQQGWSADKAIDEAKSFGMKMPCQMAFLERFAALQGQKKPGFKDDGGKKPEHA